VDTGFGCRVYGPDGGIWGLGLPLFHESGAENGISNAGSPINALLAACGNSEIADQNM
jgi:hypothetical protein